MGLVAAESLTLSLVILAQPQADIPLISRSILIYYSGFHPTGFRALTASNASECALPTLRTASRRAVRCARADTALSALPAEIAEPTVTLRSIPPGSLWVMTPIVTGAWPPTVWLADCSCEPDMVF